MPHDALREFAEVVGRDLIAFHATDVVQSIVRIDGNRAAIAGLDREQTQLVIGNGAGAVDLRIVETRVHTHAIDHLAKRVHRQLAGLEEPAADENVTRDFDGSRRSQQVFRPATICSTRNCR